MDYDYNFFKQDMVIHRRQSIQKTTAELYNFRWLDTSALYTLNLGTKHEYYHTINLNTIESSADSYSGMMFEWN